MGYILTVSDNGRYLICRVEGQMTVELAREAAREMDGWCRNRPIKGFLTDVRKAPNVSSVVKNYEFAYNDMKALNLQRHLKSAILVTPGDDSHDFIETVAQNAGYNVRIFHNEDAAIAWLNA